MTHQHVKPHSNYTWISVVTLLATACEGNRRHDARSPKGAAPLTANASQSVADASYGVEDKRVHLDLLELRHLADVHQDGLFMDFGTPARMKYTSGGWKTGFGTDAAEGDTTYTHVSATGRVYFPLEVSGEVTLRFRIKAIATENMQLFMNGKALPLVRLAGSGDGFRPYDVPVPSDATLVGENHLLMRFGGTREIGGQKVSVALDSLQVLAADDGSRSQGGEGVGTSNDLPDMLPRYDELVQNVELGGVERRSLLVHAPARISYYIDVPEQASLALRVGRGGSGQASVAVRVEPSGGKAQTLLKEDLSGQWREHIVSLGDFAGQVVKLELISEGREAVAWASPAVLVRDAKVAKLPRPAKSVIVVLIDTLRADKLRAYNAKSRVETPVLDAFAEQGTVFVRAQSPENWTKPAVASLLTGLYPVTHRTKHSESRLPDEAVMISEVLKDAGFSTGAFLANGYVSDKFGFAQGWDHYTNYIREGKNTDAENVFKEAADWIEAHKEQRFFVYIQTIDPHVPYDPPEALLNKYDPGPYSGPVSPRKTPQLLEQAKRNPPAVTFNQRDRERLEALYDGEISYHDEHFGRLLERLRALGLDRDVIIAVTSDHGEEFNEHKSYGHGHSMYQELLHVPMIFRWPSVVPAGKRIEEAVGMHDIAPTILTAVGVPIPGAMEATDRLDHIRGLPPAVPAAAFSDFLDDRRSILANRFKLTLAGVNPSFYDLGTDPGEQRPLPPEANPIAMRYCRILLGQFLGASDLRNWHSADQSGASRRLEAINTDIDPKTREGLKALGYAN